MFKYEIAEYMPSEDSVTLRHSRGSLRRRHIAFSYETLSQIYIGLTPVVERDFLQKCQPKPEANVCVNILVTEYTHGTRQLCKLSQTLR
jgi:hypothetical protein